MHVLTTVGASEDEDTDESDDETFDVESMESPSLLVEDLVQEQGNACYKCSDNVTKS